MVALHVSPATLQAREVSRETLQGCRLCKRHLTGFVIACPTLHALCQCAQGAPTSARAIPVAIFSTEPAVARSFLRKWTGELSDCARPATFTTPLVMSHTFHQ